MGIFRYMCLLSVVPYKLFIGLLIPGKSRTTLQIFSQIKIQYHPVSYLCSGNSRYSLQIFQKNFIPSHSGMRNISIPFFHIKDSKTFINRKRIRKKALRIFQCFLELSTIIIHFHHIFHIFQFQNMIIIQPFCGKNLIGFPILIDNAIFTAHFHHVRAFQNFQKSQLKLLWFQRINIIKRITETVIVLIGQSCNQVQMLMDISKAVDTVHNSFQLFKIHCSVYRFNCIRICGLYSDLQLDQTWAHG